MVFIGVVLAYNLVAQLSGGMSIYYFKYVVGNENMYQVFTAFAGLAEIAALMLFPMLSKRMSKKGVFRLACYLPAVGLIILLLAGIFVPGNAALIALSGIIVKLGSGFTLGATTVMLADVIDYGEVRFGSRNESIVASFQTLLVKTASAVSGWLIGVGLTIVGYVPNITQTAGTIFGMRILMVAVPSVITLLGLSLGSLLGGTAVVEVIFSYPGLGNLAVTSITAYDYPIIQAYVLWIALIYMIINLIVDLSYTLVDPKVRERG